MFKLNVDPIYSYVCTCKDTENHILPEVRWLWLFCRSIILNFEHCKKVNFAKIAIENDIHVLHMNWNVLSDVKWLTLRIHVCLNHILSVTAYRWGILPTWTGVKCSLDWPPPMLISRASTPAWTICLGSVPGTSMAVVNPVSRYLCIDPLVRI